MIKPRKRCASRIIAEPLRDLLVQEADFPIVLKLIINADGLPLNKSNDNCFWPIQARIMNIPDVDPYLVGVNFGPKKLKDANLFLEDFINDTLIEEKRLTDTEYLWFKFQIVACYSVLVRGITNEMK